MQWALATYACDPESTGDYTAYAAWVERAESLADEAGRSFPDEPTPNLLVDVPFLRDIFEIAASLALDNREAERDRAEREEARQREQARIERAISANDWDALHLPAPEQLAADLTASNHGVRVACHFLIFDADDGLTWYTNPYGVDGVLCNGAPSPEDARAFLLDMARGVEYGPVP